MTTYLNDILVQDDTELTYATTASPQGEANSPGPIYLQDHGNYGEKPRFRNIWIEEL